jgi:LysR family glycine cleavage system transcriptional activator
MKRNTPPLNSLRAFEATARLLSFQQAAKELNVTHSAISHQIKKLEMDLEASLFLRQGRTIQLTEVGGLYYEEVHAALKRIEQSTQELFGDPYDGELILQTYMCIMSRWLIQRLGGFKRQYPYLQIQLYNNYLSWGFDKEKADLGLIYSEKIEKGLDHHRLFRGSLVPVCSPKLLEGREINRIEQLSELPFINIIESPKNLPNWLRSQGLSREDITVAEEHDNYSLALEAVSTGQGVAIVPIFFASGDIVSNKMVIPLENLSIPELGNWYLVQEPDLLNSSRVNCFSDWLRRELKGDELLQKYSSNFNE